MPGIDVTHPEIAAQWHPTKNGEIGPADVTAGSDKKVWWRCSKTCPQGCAHEWVATIDKRCNSGRNCPICSHQKVLCEHMSINYTYPTIAAQWHPTKNGDLTPSQFIAGSNKKVWWICPKTCPHGCPHEWETTIANRTSGSGCLYCAKKLNCEHISITYTHPDIAAQWHPTKNGALLPLQFTAGSSKKIWWVCPNTCPQGCPHVWSDIINSRCKGNKGKGNGCPFCSNHQVSCIHASLSHTHPDIAAEWHPTKNNKVLATSVKYGSNKKVWWLCQKTCLQGCPHEWEASIVNRCLHNSGCPFCSNHKVSCDHVTIQYTHPAVASQWNYEKNKEFLPTNVMNGSGIKAWWRCPQNHSHEWITRVVDRCRAGTGCPHCINKTEAKLHEYLMSLFPHVHTQYRADWCKSPTSNKHLPFDFYIPSLKLLIELDGPQHFRQVSNWECHRKTTKRDVYKMQQAAAQGTSMLRLVQEEVLDASPKWLEDQVKPHLIYHKPPTQTLLSVTNPDLYADHLQLLVDTDTISIEESDSGSNVSGEEVEESVSSDDTE